MWKFGWFYPGISRRRWGVKYSIYWNGKVYFCVWSPRGRRSRNEVSVSNFTINRSKISTYVWVYHRIGKGTSLIPELKQYLFVLLKNNIPDILDFLGWPLMQADSGVIETQTIINITYKIFLLIVNFLITLCSIIPFKVKY